MHGLFPVMAGGALGAAARYLAALALPARAGWPWATFVVNLTGGFAMGILAALLLRGTASEGMRLFFGVGLLGGFTTFSAFSLESFDMIMRGHWAQVLGYTMASVVGAIAALAIGYWMIRP